MCSSGIPVEAMAKDNLSASTSSSIAVSCLWLRFTSTLFYSSWTWTSMAIAPKRLQTEASCNQLIVIDSATYVYAQD